MLDYYDSFDCQVQCEEYYNDDYYGIYCYNANEDYDLARQMQECGFYEGGM